MVRCGGPTGWRNKIAAKQAGEKGHEPATSVRSERQGLKLDVDSIAIAARLKSCPDTKDSQEPPQIQRHPERAEIFVLVLCCA
jgi:hypothetical protein